MELHRNLKSQSLQIGFFYLNYFMKFSVFILFIFVSVNSFSQNKFEKGYYIDNLSNKINCFIKNYDWRKNPDSFEIRDSNSSKITIISIADAKEVEIFNKVKFIRESLAMETSTDNIQNLSTVADLKFITKTIFLKIIIEGKNSLYKYESSDIPTRFFIKSSNNLIDWLVFKKYFNSEQNGAIVLNQSYKKQLYINANCSGITIDDVQKVKYDLADLKDFFTKINICQGEPVAASYQEIKVQYRFQPMVVLNNSGISLDFKNGNVSGKYDFTKQYNIAFGAAFEILLPFNNFNWSVFAEPTYNSYKGNITIIKEFSVNPNYAVSVNYTFIQLPLGIRRNFYVNKTSNFYVDAALNLKTGIGKSAVTIEREETIDLALTSLNFKLGAGFKFKKVVLGADYFTESQISGTVKDQNVLFNNIALTLRYSFGAD